MNKAVKINKMAEVMNCLQKGFVENLDLCKGIVSGVLSVLYDLGYSQEEVAAIIRTAAPKNIREEVLDSSVGWIFQVLPKRMGYHEGLFMHEECDGWYMHFGQERPLYMGRIDSDEGVVDPSFDPSAYLRNNFEGLKDYFYQKHK